jgi:hypothetical protein
MCSCYVRTSLSFFTLLARLALLCALLHRRPVQGQTTNGPDIDSTSVTPSSVDRISLADFEHVHSSVRQLLPFTHLSISLHPLRVDTRFALLQVHSQLWNVTLSYDPPNRPQRPNRSVQGQNIGLIRSFRNASFTQPETRWLHLSNPNNKSVQVLLLFSEYSVEHPVPGGCNLEFPVRTAPFLRLSVNEIETVLEFQRASILSDDPSKSAIDCNSLTNLLDYQVYYYFLAEGDYSQSEYMAGMQRMSSISSMQRYGQLAALPATGPHTRMRFLTYHGKGVVYNVIATHGKSRTAYVPIASYACDLHETNSCRQNSAFLHAWTLMVVSLVGLLVCYKGVKLHELQFLLFTFVLAFLVSFILFARFTRLTFVNEVTAAILTGLAVTAVFFGFWLRFTFSTVTFAMNALLSSLIISNFTLFVGLGDLDVFKVALNFWLYQIICILLVTLSFCCARRTLHLLSGPFAGAFLFVVTFEKMVNGSLIYVFVNFVRRAVHDRLYQTNNEIPFQPLDFLNTCLWALLCLTGVLFQTYHHTSKNDCSNVFEQTLNQVRRQSGSSQGSKKKAYGSVHNSTDDRQLDMQRYNQLTRGALQSSNCVEIGGDSVTVNLPSSAVNTPVRSRLRSRIATPMHQSTPKRDDMAITIADHESSPSKKTRTPNPERLSLLRSPNVATPDRSNYNAI